MHRSILIVDDEPSFLVLLDLVISQEGFRVTVAGDGFQAIDYADQESFDLVILDLRMHPMNGVALLKEFKSRWPETPVIITTGYPTTDSHNQCIEFGASAYLTKPLEISELKAVLHHLTGL
jgi:DNA-binding response OmpR family regulator